MSKDCSIVRGEAQKIADETGYDLGISKDCFGEFSYFFLPRKENRFGRDLACEVVHPTNLDKCKPGHGPCA